MMTHNVTIYIIYAVEMLIEFGYLIRIYEKRQKSYLSVFLIGLAIFLPCGFLYNYFSSLPVNFFSFIVITLVFALICFKVTVGKALIHTILLNIIMNATEVGIVSVFTELTSIKLEAFSTDNPSFTFYAVLTKIAYFIVSQLLCFIVLKTEHKNAYARQFLPLFTFPIISIFILMVFLSLQTHYELLKSYNIFFSIISMLLILASVFTFIYYQFLVKRQDKINELETEKRSYTLNQDYLGILQHQNNELQMMFHDTKNHYLTIGNLNDINEVK